MMLYVDLIQLPMAFMMFLVSDVSLAIMLHDFALTTCQCSIYSSFSTCDVVGFFSFSFRILGR